MALPYERPVHWIGSSKEDLRATPEDVQDVIGRALQKVQWGGKPINSSFWRGAGSGVLEIKDDYDGDTYRCVYTVRLAKAVYVLHVFQKKSTEVHERNKDLGARCRNDKSTTCRRKN